MAHKQAQYTGNAAKGEVKMTELTFYWLDAFTDRKYGGNPCAVVMGADQLADDEMQRLAQEMGLSETAFVMYSPKSPEADFGARYFMLEGEIPLAGHPTIASISALVAAGQVQRGSAIKLELPAGVIPITIGTGDTPLITMSQCKPEFLDRHDPEVVADFLGLKPSELLSTQRSELPCQTVSTGSPQLMVPIKDIETLRKVRFDGQRYSAFAEGKGIISVHVFCPKGITAEGSTFARHFAMPGPQEDAFTGSATGGMAAYCYHYGLIETPKFVAEQGHDLGRPGRAEVEVVGSPEDIATVKVSGTAVVLIEGRIRL